MLVPSAVPFAVQPFPASTGCTVAFVPYRVTSSEREVFEEQFCTSSDALLEAQSECFMLLRRRNDVVMYGKLHSDYPISTPEYYAFSVFSSEEAARKCDTIETTCTTLSESPLLWDATQILHPSSSADTALSPGVPAFLATNRFPVRSECAALFEERWAQRNSGLPSQPGFMGFSLLRRRGPLGKVGGEPEMYTYSTATLWACEDAWQAWREGGGKDAHVASKTSNRTPVSEWMSGKASPIFFDVPVYVQRDVVNLA